MTRWSTQHPKPIPPPRPVPLTDAQRRVLELLGPRWVTVNELARGLGHSANGPVGRVLQDLRRLGLAETSVEVRPVGRGPATQQVRVWRRAG